MWYLILFVKNLDFKRRRDVLFPPKRIFWGSTFYSIPINAVEFLKQIWPSSLMMFHNFADFSFVLRCATLCNDVLEYWFNFFFVLRCDQKYWIRLPTLFNIAQQSCVQDCWIMLNEFGRVIKFANEKRKERERTKWGCSRGWRLREGGRLNQHEKFPLK